ncbi:SMI1/KNR4 family protein [Streptomyces scabiei]|uniref:Knr4/Smi1-like domain-containing protein n=1 Tax=Streptomyces scabiei TaxID=1930 RepID=A0A100JLN8_STRSC|nr:SMI1/KNR4 family protein [Streptomyces scabiei]GAQ61824.1 hypothetical protein SsS58_02178 [Streptomyces scabiei]
MRQQPPPPPLTEAETAEAEQELGVSLPAEYRDCLREVSAGGAPARLERTERGWRWAGNDEAGEFEDMKTAGAVVVQEHGRATCDRIVPLSLDHLGAARPVRFAEWLRHGSWALLPPDWPRHPSTPVVPGQSPLSSGPGTPARSSVRRLVTQRWKDGTMEGDKERVTEDGGRAHIAEVDHLRGRTPAPARPVPFPAISNSPCSPADTPDGTTR